MAPQFQIYEDESPTYKWIQGMRYGPLLGDLGGELLEQTQPSGVIACAMVTLVRHLVQGSQFCSAVNPVVGVAELNFGLLQRGIAKESLNPVMVFTMDVPWEYADTVLVALHNMIQCNFATHLHITHALKYELVQFAISPRTSYQIGL